MLAEAPQLFGAEDRQSSADEGEPGGGEERPPAPVGSRRRFGRAAVAPMPPSSGPAVAAPPPSSQRPAVAAPSSQRPAVAAPERPPSSQRPAVSAPDRVSRQLVEHVFYDGMRFVVLKKFGVKNGISIRCETCQRSRNISHVEAHMTEREAARRLGLWMRRCPEHNRARFGGPLCDHIL